MYLIVIIILVLGCFTLWLVWATAVSVTEEIYMHIFKRPIYVHFYPRKKELSQAQKYLLRQNLPFYNRLSDRHKSYFRHRVACFINNHTFIGKEGFIVDDKVKTLIAATSIMLTFGMRKYLFEVVNKIIIYPSSYLSTITGEYHKGEFNPSAKAVVFSWEDFLNGFEADSDNVNLGLHEFSHVVQYHGTRREDSSAILFARMYKRITDDFNNAENRQKLIDSAYFRVYGYTNKFEFLAVIIEHYFETPAQFRSAFPELYKNVGLMLNHRHH